MILLALSVAFLAGGVVIPALTYLSFWPAILARISLRRQATRAGAISVDRERGVRMLLWLLTGGLALTALLFFSGVEGLSGAAGLLAGLLCAGGSVAAFLAVRHRSATP